MKRLTKYLIVVVSFTAIGIGVFGAFFSTGDHELIDASPVSTLSVSSFATEHNNKAPGTNPQANALVAQSNQPADSPQLVQSHERSFGEAVKFRVGEICDDSGCVTRPIAQHEYENYSVEELTAIAEYDGAAAIVLANKLAAGDTGEARQWAMHAFLLTKDPYAFHMASTLAGAYPGETTDAKGNLDASAAQRAYIWLKVGYVLGVNDGADLGTQEMILDRHGYLDRDKLDLIAAARVERLTSRRAELTGEVF